MTLSLFSLPAAAVAAQADSMALISHNIANINTPGSKSSVAQFRPLLAEAQGSETKQRGRHGIQAYERTDVSRQGVPFATGRRLDLALSGNGFFAVQSAAGEISYTRNGNFQTLFDAAAPAGENSFLGDSFGNYVLGWQADASFAFPTRTAATLDRILVSDDLSLNGVASTEGSVEAVLPINNGVSDEVLPFEHELLLIDGGTQSNSAAFRYTPVAGEANAWNLRVFNNDRSAQLGEAILRFNGDGRLASLTGVGGSVVEGNTLTVQGAGTGGAINARVDLAGVRSFGGGGQVVQVSSDGVQSGLLDRWSISGRGVLEGEFSNGESAAFAQIAIADITNPDSFIAEEGSRFRLSEQSGDVTYYDLLTSSRARVSSGHLEASTVDLSEQFARMIETQNAYNLASLTLQTINDLSRTAVQTKR